MYLCLTDIDSKKISLNYWCIFMKQPVIRQYAKTETAYCDPRLHIKKTRRQNNVASQLQTSESKTKPGGCHWFIGDLHERVSSLPLYQCERDVWWLRYSQQYRWWPPGDDPLLLNAHVNTPPKYSIIRIKVGTDKSHKLVPTLGM